MPSTKPPNSRSTRTRRELQGQSEPDIRTRPSESRHTSPRNVFELEHLVTSCSSDLLTVHGLDGTFLYASEETMSLFGLRPEELWGRRLQEFVRSDDVALVDTEMSAIEGHETRRFRYRIEGLDRTPRWVETRLRRSDDLLIAATRDIDHEISRQSAEWARLKLEARTDWLTQLKNRWGLEEVLETELDRYLRRGNVLSVALLDVDGFKQVNDRHGHGFGDHVLRRIASVIDRGRRSYDVLGRWGGDEFLLILPDTTVEAACGVATRMVQEVEREWTNLPESEAITLSGGVVDSVGAESIAPLLDRADAAMYRAKREGGNRVCVAEATEPGTEKV